MSSTCVSVVERSVAAEGFEFLDAAQGILQTSVRRQQDEEARVALDHVVRKTDGEQVDIVVHEVTGCPNSADGDGTGVCVWGGGGGGLDWPC